MKNTVTLIPGDGIGPEVSKAVCQVIEAAGVKMDWEVVNRGRGPEAESARKLLTATVESVRRTKVGLKGPIKTPIAGGYRSINVGLRQELELYANLRPVKNLKGVPSVFRGVDMVLVRENTEDLYSGVEHTIVPGVVVSLKIITEKASTRIARFAFAYARQHKRRKIHAVHKANIMKVTDGLFLECIRKVAAEHREIEYHELIVDNTAMQLVLNPRQFDVLLLTNLYGDILSDLAAGLVGGLGVVPSANLGEEAAIFEAVHGTAPMIAGKGIANPTALLLSAVMMLEHLGESEAARRIEASVQNVYAEGQHMTQDLGGRAGTQEFTEAIVRTLESVESTKRPSD
jgi:isocitrate dehydrogenase (NAD+)